MGDRRFLSIHIGTPRQDQQQGVCHAILQADREAGRDIPDCRIGGEDMHSCGPEGCEKGYMALKVPAACMREKLSIKAQNVCEHPRCSWQGGL